MPPQFVYPTPSRTPCPCPSTPSSPSSKSHFLAPKLVRTFLVSLPSVSLSSAAAFFLLLFLSCPVLPPPPPALLGVGAPDGPSRPPPNVLDMGVGAGVEPGVCESWLRVQGSVGRLCPTTLSGPGTKRNKCEERQKKRTAAAGLYDTELREKTRFWSASPVLRRCATAALAPLT